MVETIRFELIGAQDINFGTGTFEAVLADGRHVVLTQVHAGSIPSPSGDDVEAYIVELRRARRGLAMIGESRPWSGTRLGARRP